MRITHLSGYLQFLLNHLSLTILWSSSARGIEMPASTSASPWFHGLVVAAMSLTLALNKNLHWRTFPVFFPELLLDLIIASSLCPRRPLLRGFHHSFPRSSQRSSLLKAVPSTPDCRIARVGEFDFSSVERTDNRFISRTFCRGSLTSPLLRVCTPGVDMALLEPVRHVEVLVDSWHLLCQLASYWPNESSSAPFLLFVPEQAPILGNTLHSTSGAA